MNLTRIFLAICLLAAATVTTSQAASEEEGNLLGISAESRMWSRYMGVQGAIWYNKPVSTPSVTIELLQTPLRGLYFNLCMHAPLDNTAFRNKNFGTEIAFIMGYSGKIKSVAFNAGISYFETKPVFRFSNGDVWQSFVEVEKEIRLSKNHAISPFLRLEVLFPRQNNPRNGIYLFPGLKHSWNIAGPITLNHKINLLYDSGALGLQESLHLQYATEIKWPINKWLTLKPLSAYFSMPLPKTNDGRRPNAVFSSGFALSF